MVTRPYKDYLDWLLRNEKDSFVKSISERRLGDSQAEYIAKLIQQRKFRNILEIGRYKGFSLGLFKFFSADSHVYSVDTYLHPEVQRIVRQFVSGVVLLHGTSDMLSDLRTRFDICLIDGDHRYEPALNDWNNVKKMLMPGAIILFDDVDKKPADFGYEEHCGRAFDEACKDIHVRLFTKVGSLGIIETY